MVSEFIPFLVYSFLDTSKVSYIFPKCHKKPVFFLCWLEETLDFPLKPLVLPSLTTGRPASSHQRRGSSAAQWDNDWLQINVFTVPRGLPAKGDKKGRLTRFTFLLVQRLGFDVVTDLTRIWTHALLTTSLLLRSATPDHAHGSGNRNYNWLSRFVLGGNEESIFVSFGGRRFKTAYCDSSERSNPGQCRWWPTTRADSATAAVPIRPRVNFPLPVTPKLGSA
ncbi:hypothetical protein J6590_057927 [Homalodisca vitripennis]|nr:hypothetical protein J6590_057927 [Homalodisca vitripennis]